MPKTAILCALAACISFPALADWQYTRWGMSPAEAIEASSGALRAPTDAERRGLRRQDRIEPGAIGTYEVGGLAYSVDLGFDERGKLALVALKLLDWGRRHEVQDSLIGTYGAPIESRRDSYGVDEAWRDAARGNLVRLYVAPAIRSLTVLYSPLGSGL
ncbi:MAG: hypothetical protein AB7O45_13115 [Alphaproteobacteria bacterium]